MISRFPAAELEAEWFLTVGDSAMGQHAAQRFDGVGGGDLIEGIRARHGTLLARAVTGRDTEKHRRVAATFARLDRPCQLAIVSAYQPRSWDPVLRAQAGPVGAHGTLAGTLLIIDPVHDAFRIRFDRDPDGAAELVTFLTDAARRDNRTKVFRPWVRHARVLLDGALEAYEALRRARIAAARGEAAE